MINKLIKLIIKVDKVNNYFTLNKNINSHDPRLASNMLTDYKRKNYGKFSLKYRGRKFGITCQ